MFIRHKIKRVVAKHWKISLYLAFIAFFVLLTALTYFIPNVAILVLGIILVITCLFLLTADGLQTCDHNVVKSWLRLLTALLIVIITLATELKVFHGWGWL